MRVRTSLIGLLVACGVGITGTGTAVAQSAGPPAGYKIYPKYTKTSPDGAVTLEQYLNEDTDDWKWQFWARWQSTFTQLDPGQADYPAGFVFTNDLKWIVRIQKIGSGTSTHYLYRLTPRGYAAASKKPLGELAWAYMKTRLDWRKIRKPPEVTLDLKLTYLRPLSVKSGTVSAEGKLIKLGRQTSYTEGFVRDGAGNLAVHATATFTMIGVEKSK